MGKHSQIDFDCGLIDGARWAGLNISETADLLGFLCMTVSRVHREWCEIFFLKKHSMSTSVDRKALLM